jgi:hypothetical protein
MKISEKILAILALIAVILMFLFIPGGSVLWVFSITFLACIYCQFGFALFNQIGFRKIFKSQSYKGISTWRIVGAIGAGIALSIALLGILFKLQQWPGAQINLMVGVFGSFVLLIIVSIKYFETKAVYYKGIMIRTLVIGGLGLAMIFISSLSLIKLRYRKYPEYIKAYELYTKNPQNMELRNNLNLELEKVNSQQD